MAVFKPIESPGDLPAPLTSREQFALDFKGDQPRPFDKFEMAKDVATFANAGGGTVLVGAQEDGLGRLGVYRPFAERHASDIKEAFEVATRDRCYPRPLMDAVVLPHQGAFVVAINVWPFPAQFVGVAVRGDATDGYGDSAYVFPVRIGTHCQFLSPDQIALFMLPKMRQVSIHLGRITEGAVVNIVDSRILPTLFLMGEVKTLDNVLTLRAKSTSESWEFNVPLDTVKTVWKDTNGLWQVVIDGFLNVPGDNGVPVYNPVRTQA